MNSPWKAFFDTIAQDYENENSARNTVAEVQFIVDELGLQPGASILDIGCGTGRHAVEFARRGYSVTGVDISSGMLAIARKKAEDLRVSVELIECAAQDYTASRKFDAALSLCEGGLCLFSESDDIWGKDMAVLANMSEALKPGGRFMLTVLNAFALIRSASDESVASGEVDLFTLTSKFTNECGPEGAKVQIRGTERYYTPPEMVRMVNRIGMKIDAIYGGTTGNWRRGDILLDEIEFMAVGTRKK